MVFLCYPLFILGGVTLKLTKQRVPLKILNKRVLSALGVLLVLGVIIGLVKIKLDTPKIDYSKQSMGVKMDENTITEYTGNNVSINDSEDLKRGTLITEAQMIADEMGLDMSESPISCDYEELSQEDKTAIADTIQEAFKNKNVKIATAKSCESLQKDGKSVELDNSAGKSKLTSKEIFDSVTENMDLQISFKGANYVTKGDNVFDVYLVATIPVLDENLEPELLAYSKGEKITQAEFESLYTRNISEFPTVEKVIEVTVVKCDNGEFKLTEEPSELLGIAGSDEYSVDYTDINTYLQDTAEGVTYNLTNYYTTTRSAETVDELKSQYPDEEFNFLDSAVYLAYYNKFSNISIYEFELQENGETVDYLRYVRYNDLVLNGDDVVVVQKTEKCSVFDEDKFFSRFIRRLNSVIPNLVHY